MTTLSDIIAESALLTVDNTKTVTNKTISGASNTIDNLNASNLSSGTVDTARLASGTADATTYLRGDQTWAAAGLNYFNDSENTTAPNDTKPVDILTAANAGTDVDVAIVPKGTGAFSLQVPDNTNTGGNKRGNNAIDLQTIRSSASNVASGGYSFVAGNGNTSTNIGAVAVGYNNIASGNYSTAIGYTNTASGTGGLSLGYANTSTGVVSIALGYDNTSSAERSFAVGELNTASANYTTAIGYSNDATELYATAIGRDNLASGNGSVALGYSNTASGGQATGLGFANTASGSRSFVVGYNNNASNSGSIAMGNFNTSSGTYSVALGSNNISDGDYATALGLRADTKGRKSVVSIGVYTNAGNYNTNTSIFTAGGQTTDATPTPLHAWNTASETYYNLLNTNSAYTLKILVVGMDTTYNVKSWEISALIKNASGTVSIVGTPTKTVVAQDTGASTWDVDFVLGTTVSGFTVQATGAAATTINWTATMHAAEVKV